MNKNEEITYLFQRLRLNNIYATFECVSDIKAIVTGDTKSFAKKAYKELSRINLEENKFETLKLTDEQKRRMNFNPLYRYEYRKGTNLRCIFYIQLVKNTNIPIMLCAFTEDGDKKKGKNSYNHNIERAIKLYEKYNKSNCFEGDV